MRRTLAALIPLACVGALLAAPAQAGAVRPASATVAEPVAGPGAEPGADRAARALTVNRRAGLVRAQADGVGLVVQAGPGGVRVRALRVDGRTTTAGPGTSRLVDARGRTMASSLGARAAKVRAVRGGAVVSFVWGRPSVRISERWLIDVGPGGVRWRVHRSTDLAQASRNLHVVSPRLVFQRSTWQNVRRPVDGGSIPVWGSKLVAAAEEFTRIDGLRRNGILLESAPNHAVFETGDLVFLSHARTSALEVDLSAKGVHPAVTLGRLGRPGRPEGLSVEWEGSRSPWAFTNGVPKGYGGRFSEEAGHQLLAAPRVRDRQVDRLTFRLSTSPTDRYYDGLSLRNINDEALSRLVNDFGRVIVQDRAIGASSERSFRAGEAPGFTSPWNVWSLELLQDAGAFASMRQQISDIYAAPLRDPAAPNAGRLGGLQATDGRLFCCRPFARVNESQPTYATTDNTLNVVLSAAELYDRAPDRRWLGRIAASVRRSLDWVDSDLVIRSGPTQGLVGNVQCEDVQASTGCATDWSEWNDQYDIGQVSAYHNVMAYAALTGWAALERDVLGSPERAAHYEALAAGIKERYNATTDQGGFWSPATRSYAYTRDETGAVVKDCTHLFANGYALMFDLVDTDERRTAVASTLREEYRRLETTGHVYDHGAHGGTDYRWRLYGSNPRTCQSGEELEGGGPRMYFPFFEDGGVHLLNEQPGAQIGLELGERSRAIAHARTAVDRYTWDHFMGWSNIQPDTLMPRRDIWQEPFMVNNVLGVWPLFHDVLGFQPRHDRLDLLPFIDGSLVGSSLTYRLHGRQPVHVRYPGQDEYVVATAGPLPVRVGWRGEPGEDYVVEVDGRESTVAADERGRVWVESPGRGSHTYRLVGQATSDLDDDRFVFSAGWWEAPGDPFFGGSLRGTSEAGATAALRFTGTGVALLGSTGGDKGRAEIRLDGELVEVADWYADPPGNQQVVVDLQGLDPGEHTLTVTVLGEHDPASAGSQVNIDGATVTAG